MRPYLRRIGGPWRYPGFRWYWCGSSVHAVSQGMQFLVLAWLVLEVSFQCLRELYEPLQGGSFFGGNMAEIAEMAEKSGRSGRIFFLVLAVVTLLHQFIRFRLSSPVPAASPRLSQTPDSRRSAGSWGGEVSFPDA